MNIEIELITSEKVSFYILYKHKNTDIHFGMVLPLEERWDIQKRRLLRAIPDLVSYPVIAKQTFGLAKLNQIRQRVNQLLRGEPSDASQVSTDAASDPGAGSESQGAEE